MIESPQEAILFEPIPTTDDNTDAAINRDPEVVLLKQPFLTSSFRATLRHLQSKGGIRARFRGLSVYIANLVAIHFTASIVSTIPFVPRSLCAVLTSVACAQLSLAWTHIVISDPSPMKWFRRVPRGLKIWKKVAAPTAILAVAEQLAIVLPMYLAMIYGIDLKDPESGANLAGAEKKLALVKMASVAGLAMVLGVLLVIPANVTLTRVQASLLDDSEETIVPFDRSFGGKVEPEIVGGSGVLGMLDAWKTFDWNARVRLVKAYLKVWAMQLVLTLFFTICGIAELFIIVGKDWSKLVPQDPKDGAKN
jgi:hypothetical protein